MNKEQVKKLKAELTDLIRTCKQSPLGTDMYFIDRRLSEILKPIEESYQLFPKPDEELRERIASRYMVQCKNSKDFECLYIGTCPHEDKEICQWQLDNADEILALTASIYEEEKIEYGESVNENIYRHGNQGNST